MQSQNNEMGYWMQDSLDFILLLCNNVSPG